MTQCEECQYFGYDEEYDEYGCGLPFSMDEDEYARMAEHPRESCPYYRRGEEYTVVLKQFG